MNVSRWAELARAAARRPPRVIAARLVREARRQARRPWSRVRPRLLTPQALLRRSGATSIDALWDRLAEQPFVLRPADRERWTAEYRSRYPGAAALTVAAADRVLAHEFDLLGSGPVALGPRLTWTTDFKSGRTWPLAYAPDININDLDRPSDIKVPWELSRCQHFATLGQAYWLTGDERYAAEFASQVDDWLAANPWLFGVNWICAMDVALRAMSWIWAFQFMARSQACADSAFRARFLTALVLHAEFIDGNLERAEVNGNHYLTDGVGLVFLGCFFRDLRGSQRWLNTGRHIVTSEIALQTSSDGVDFEKSIPYHRLVTEGFLTAYLVLKSAGHAVPADCWERLSKMLEFTAAYTKPSGLAPLIGDADDGRMQTFGRQALNDHRYLAACGAVLFERPDLKAAAGEFADEAFWLLGPDAATAFDAMPAGEPADRTSRPFFDGGFFVMRAPGTHAIVDCGEVGMHGRGGHGHNDILGFELVLDGMPLVTDCGAYLYTASERWRNWFRSTAAHNVVQIDDEELNGILPGDLWRLRYDARPLEVEWKDGDAVVRFHGGHSGYAKLPSPVTCERTIVLDKAAPVFAIRDRVSGNGRHRVTSRFHLDPAVRAGVEGDVVVLNAGGRDAMFLTRAPDAGATVGLEESWVSPGYGRKVSTACIVVEADVDLPLTLDCAFTTLERGTGSARMRSLLETFG
jgi:hypothetical protein